MSSKTYGILSCCFAILFCSSATYAAIIDSSTRVYVWAEIYDWDKDHVLWTETDQGAKYSAVVDSENSGDSVGTSARASISVDIGSPELSIVDFHRNLWREVDSDYGVNQISETYWQYSAVTDSTAIFSWNLTYGFYNRYAASSFEGKPVVLTAEVWDGSKWSFSDRFIMGPDTNYDPAGTYSGNVPFELLEGHTYKITLFSDSMLRDYKPYTYSSLNGYVSLNFNGAPVPIPSALWLLGSGIVGTVGFRRKFQK